MTEYISREAAIKRFTFATLDRLGMEPTICASDVVLALQSIPAADVRPVVMGKWEEKEKDGVLWYACSVCGEHIPKGRWGQEWHSNFCPNCGADMRGESNV